MHTYNTSNAQTSAEENEAKPQNHWSHSVITKHFPDPSDFKIVTLSLLRIHLFLKKFPKTPLTKFSNISSNINSISKEMKKISCH